MMVIETARFFSGSKLEAINTRIRISDIAHVLDAIDTDVGIIERGPEEDEPDYDLITHMGQIVGWLDVEIRP